MTVMISNFFSSRFDVSFKAHVLVPIMALDEENGSGEKGDKEEAAILLRAYAFILSLFTSNS